MTAGFTFARWFGGEHYVNRPEDDFAREEVLGEVNQFEGVAKHEDVLLVKTPNGACMIEYDETHGKKGEPGCLVTFDYVEDTRWTRTRFWYNESSVRALVAELESAPRADFEELFVQGKVKVVS